MARKSFCCRTDRGAGLPYAPTPERAASPEHQKQLGGNCKINSRLQRSWSSWNQVKFLLRRNLFQFVIWKVNNAEKGSLVPERKQIKPQVESNRRSDNAFKYKMKQGVDTRNQK